MARTVEIISVDDHILEPPGVWQERLPAKLRDAGPRLVNGEQGEVWVCENSSEVVIGLSAAAGRAKEEFGWGPVPYAEMRPGCFDPVARLEDMDRDNVVASVPFPSLQWVWKGFTTIEDKTLALACVKAYNDFMVDEWAGAAPGRYVPMIILPLWDAHLAATEIERAAAKGAKAICFPEIPAMLGLPSIHQPDHWWDPVFGAASSTGLPLCMHMGSAGSTILGSPDAPPSVFIACSRLNAARALADWLLSDTFPRFPDLKVCYSEGDIGWIPFMLGFIDYTWDRHGYWTETKIDRRPSDFFKTNVFGCVIPDEDPHGTQHIREIGIENCMLETDYPHPDSSWPHTVDVVLETLGHLDDDELYKVTRGNAERVFGFTPSGLGQR